MLAKTLLSFKVAAVLSKSPLLSKLPFFAAFCSFSLIQKRSDYQKKSETETTFQNCFLLLSNFLEPEKEPRHGAFTYYIIYSFRYSA